MLLIFAIHGKVCNAMSLSQKKGDQFLNLCDNFSDQHPNKQNSFSYFHIFFPLNTFYIFQETEKILIAFTLWERKKMTQSF